MGITVSKIEIQFSERLSLRLMAGRTGLNRNVEKMAVMETKDFVYGADPDGMFVISTLSFVDADGSGIEEVVELLNKKPSAMAIKVKRYVDKIPSEILKAAEENEVPLFEIYSNVQFSYFISVISEALVLNSNIRDDRGDRPTLFLSRNAMNEPVESIIELLGKLLGFSCFFMDLEGRMKGHFLTPESSFRGNLSALGERMLERSLSVTEKEFCFYDENTSVFPCFVGKNLLGILVFIESGVLSEEVEDLILQSMSYIALRMCEQSIAEHNIPAGCGHVLLDEVLFQDTKDAVWIKNRLKNGGFEILEYYAFIIVSAEREKMESSGPAIMEYCRIQLSKCFDRYLMKRDNHTLKCLVTFSKDSNSLKNGGLYDRLIAFKNRTFATNGDAIDIGLSLVQEDPAELTQSFLQAQTAMSLGRLYRPEKHVYDYRSFLVQGLLSRSRDTQEYQWLMKNVVESISKRDQLYESGLWESLDILFKVRSLKSAADELHIHISTLRYRLQKIKDITGFDYLSAYGNYVLHTAYLIWMDSKSTEK